MWPSVFFFFNVEILSKLLTVRDLNEGEREGWLEKSTLARPSLVPVCAQTSASLFSCNLARFLNLVLFLLLSTVPAKRGRQKAVTTTKQRLAKILKLDKSGRYMR